MLHQFSEVKFKDHNNLQQIVHATRTALCTDKELPVRVEAAIAIQMLLTSQTKGSLALFSPSSALFHMWTFTRTWREKDCRSS